MQTYGEYSPTGFDPAGAFLPDQKGWLVAPVQRNRDSDELDESNFEAALEALGGEGDDVEVHRFGHWACGWFELILVRPGTVAAEVAEALEVALANYPALDEDDFCAREYASYNEGWAGWGAREFVAELTRRLDLDEAQEDALYSADKDALQTFFEGLNPCGDYYVDAAPYLEPSLRNATLEDVEAFLADLPAPATPGGLDV